MDWGQFRTILWLRWRLTRNQLARGSSINVILSIIIMVIVLLLGAVGGIGGLLFGVFSFRTISPSRMLITWDIITIAFLFFWMIGLVSEIQRSETIDIGKLLHLPTSLKQVFLINYIASHVTFSIILFVPFTLGLCIGLVFGHSIIMILLLPLVIGFIFMITSWTYCLRGWLVTLMTNQRRRRTVIAIVTFSFIILIQLPNMLGNVFGYRAGHRPGNTQSSQPREQIIPPSGFPLRTIPSGVLLAHNIVPFLWVGNGAMSLTDDSPWSALLGAAASWGLGWFGIRRAYRTTIRFYQGAAGDSVKTKAKKEKTQACRKNILTRSLPFVSDETSALTFAFFQNLRRATEVKIMLASNFLMMLFFSSMIFFRHSSNISENFKPFIFTVAIVLTFFGLVQLMFNQFGFDRNGFRSLVLSPVPRKHILCGKNLAFLPVVVIIGGVLIIIMKIFLHVSIWFFVAAIFQLISAYLFLCILGNIISIINPYRIASGSMKPTKMSALNTIVLILSNTLFPAAIIPTLIPPASALLMSKIFSLPAGLIDLVLSILLLIVTIFVYQFSLTHFGQLLQKREKRILEIVTREIE